MFGPEISGFPRLIDGRNLIEVGLNFSLVWYENPSLSYWTCGFTHWDYYMEPACYTHYTSQNYIYPINCFQKGAIVGTICKRPQFLSPSIDNYKESICTGTSQYINGECSSTEIEFNQNDTEKDSCYKIFTPNNSTTWNDAYRICKTLGYNLLEIETDKESEFLLNLLPKYPAPGRYSVFGESYSDWWAIGLHKILYKSGWYWSSKTLFFEWKYHKMGTRYA